MTDFLSKLASRTLGMVPLAEPSITPLFATEPLTSTTVTYDEFLEIAQDVQESNIPARLPELLPDNAERAASSSQSVQQDQPQPASQAVAAPVMHTTSAALAPIVPTPIMAPPPRQQPERVAARADAPIAPQQKVARRVLSTSPALMTEAALPVRRSPLSVAATQLETRSATDERPSAAEEQSVSSPPPTSSDIRDERLLIPLNPAMVHAVRLDSPATADRGGLLVAVTPTKMGAAPRRAENRSVATVAAPPAASTIEITIGRVEVRAIHPPAPTPRPKTTGPIAPSLSLEAYLRNQNGGKR